MAAQLNWHVAPIKSLQFHDDPHAKNDQASQVSESETRSVLSDSETPGAVVPQAPLSVKFSRQEYWAGLTFPSPGDLPNPGINPRSPASEADSLSSEPEEKPTRVK